jgi:hypothetical protein
LVDVLQKLVKILVLQKSAKSFLVFSCLYKKFLDKKTLLFLKLPLHSEEVGFEPTI